MFQRIIEQLLQNIPGVVVFLDVIVVTGKNEDEYVEGLEVLFMTY